MTDSLTKRVEQLEKDLSFLTRHMELSRTGHATITEYERASAIRDRYPREGTEPDTSGGHRPARMS